MTINDNDDIVETKNDAQIDYYSKWTYNSTSIDYRVNNYHYYNYDYSDNNNNNDDEDTIYEQVDTEQEDTDNIDFPVQEPATVPVSYIEASNETNN